MLGGEGGEEGNIKKIKKICKIFKHGSKVGQPNNIKKMFEFDFHLFFHNQNWLNLHTIATLETLFHCTPVHGWFG